MFEHRLVQRACRTAGPLVCLFLVLFPLGARRSTQPGGPPIKVGLIDALYYDGVAWDYFGSYRLAKA